MPFEFDVFLSHSSKDKPIVRDLAERLKGQGLRVWFDEWEIRAGDSIPHKVNEGLETSRILLLAMSVHAFGSDWATLESDTFRFNDPLNKERRFVPVLLDDAEIKASLKQFLYIDWRQKAPDQFERLVVACRPPKPRPAPAAVITSGDSLVLKGHSEPCQCVALSEDGRLAVSGSSDRLILVWDLEANEPLATLEGHANTVWSVAVSSDGRHIVSGSNDSTIRIWDVQTGKCTGTLVGPIHWVTDAAMSRDGRQVISGSRDGMLRVWDLQTEQLIETLDGHTDSILCVALSVDGRQAVSGSADRTIRIWDLANKQSVASLEGHSDEVNGIAVTADGRFAVSASDDRTVRVWDLNSRKLVATLEGHTEAVYAVAVTPDGRRAVSGSFDNTVRVWDLEARKLVATLQGHTDVVFGVAISADGRRAVSGSADGTSRVWDLSSIARATNGDGKDAHYTNAKVLIVGDSGVGKTGLAIRLAQGRFQETISTDGAWATQLPMSRVEQGGAEREIWLWDFAGQADYRLVHLLYMDETALALFVFNPQSENPFEGLGQWDRDLRRAARRPFKKLLVAGRCDRGGLMISRAMVDQFCKERGFEGYFETSAYRGTGCEELRDAIIRAIPWQDIPWTSSPRIFKLLKDEIVKLKDEGKVLLRMSELRQQLELRLPGESFTTSELRAVVGLLVGPGVVWPLEFGNFVLLQPERINAYAAAVIRSVRAHTEDIGCIAEEDVLNGKLDYQDMQRLPVDEEQIVLKAMHQALVGHGLCLREHTDNGTFLVFPSYFKRERPELEGHPLVLVTYQFNGPLDEIYATLVVRLHHVRTFDRDRLWRFAADFKAPAGKRLGFKMTKKGEGAAELQVYFEPGIAIETQVTFIRYVHEHLQVKAQEVIRIRHYVCPHCGTPVENRKAVEKRLTQGEKDILCVACEQRIELVDLIEERFASKEFRERVRELEAQAKTGIDNESRELILVGHAYAVAGEAGQIFRQYAVSDHGIDGEIEFKDHAGNASGERLYLQLRSAESFDCDEKAGGRSFTIKNSKDAAYWRQHAYPVMLVIRNVDGTIHWMDVRATLAAQSGKKSIKNFVFNGEPLTAYTLRKLREKTIGPPPSS